ncbi:Ejaculatory bulb-specific protein 3 [Eumeta japonica]|uniref:Ejaculatory bulb-specific protein 3 n=1 Tax=Eumeta variegata TaxID=151549 RepID=A0A4C1T2Y0_EUMVA|nr:Ejaculatory bulb-specific protein 3 [Eumeta japonica]
MLCMLHWSRAYDERYDAVDIEGIVAHDLVHRAVNGCLLDEVDCGEFWREVKVIAKEIATTRCAKCTPRQKFIIKTYSVATKKKYPEVWKQLRYMYKNS